MKNFGFVALVIVGLSSACATSTSEDPTIKTAQSVSDSPIVLVSSDLKVPPFNDLAHMFDLTIPSEDYESIRRLYFDTFVAPRLENKAAEWALWEEFKQRTERPAPGSVKRTGLTAKGARELVIWFADQDQFTVGSSKDDVLRVQGTPDEIGDSMWRYGGSHVFFEANRVTRWDVFPLSPLKVKLRPSNTAEAKPKFSVGSTKDEVLHAQGPPNEFSEGNWKYGSSVVFFDGGRVTRWDNPQHSLYVPER